MPRVAAVQLEPHLGDVSANLTACEALLDDPAIRGAEWIVLPEFFTTGMAFLPELGDAALPFDGPATDLLSAAARRHGAFVGGSFLCRDDDGHVRNAFVLAGPDGVIGRHDKDEPTMWENAFYVGGTDDGLLDAARTRVGVALCWELIRGATVRRLRGRSDVVLGGSAWWSVPSWPPRGVTARWAAANARNATEAPSRFARLVGAPVVHGAHAGRFACPLPWMPFSYEGRYEGGATICDAGGRVLARRPVSAGKGVIAADVEFGAAKPVEAEPPAGRRWLVDRGPVPAVAWELQRAHGRRYYRSNHRAAGDAFVPAAGREAFTGIYDAVIALTMRERTFRGRLLDRLLADTSPNGELKVVDVGAGTGTLAIALAGRGAEVTAVEPDVTVLARARGKAGAHRVHWREGRADRLPVDDATVDRVVCSLVLHHLSDDTKLRALCEARRVLRPGGRLHIADWGPARDPAMAAAFRILQALDGKATTRAHADGRIPELVDASGFSTQRTTDRLRTGWGQLELITAHKEHA